VTPALFALMDKFTPSQLLAVYDVCQLLTETLSQRYQDILLEEMIARDRDNGFRPFKPPDETAVDIPFDDDPPF